MNVDLSFSEEDPPEYDVKERLKTLNEELANDPTPVEKSNSKVVFKANLVDLVAPPPDYPDEETPRENSETPQTQESENSNNSETEKKDNGKKVLIERDGKFELVSENDVRAKDMGLPVLIDENENVNNNTTDTSSNSGEFNRKPAPPSQPRPSTANGNSRRSRPGSSKQRASSAGTERGFVLGDFNYNSPYAMSPKEKKLVEEQAKQREQRERDKKRLEEQEKEYQERESNDAFQAWLRQKREEARKRKEREEEDKKKKNQSPRVRMCLSVCLPVCLSICLSVCLSNVWIVSFYVILACPVGFSPVFDLSVKFANEKKILNNHVLLQRK